MSVSDNQDNSHIEDILTPPKYDGLGVVMSIIAALITSVVSGTIILIAAYVSIGNFSLESGVSPILLALITFFGLTIGNILYYILLSKVFPHIYTRGRTAIAQVAIMSILLYIFFAPVYVIVSTTLLDTDGILVAFGVHIVINTFALQLVMGITANYRYSLLSLYANIVSLLISSLIMFSVFVSFSDSGTALFLLLGLVIVAQVIGTTCSHGIAWIYAHIYSVTGYDPIGSVFSRIEQEEKSLEQEAEKLLTQFPQK